MKDVPESSRPTPTSLGNDEIARALDEAADLLEQRDSNPFRIRAFRRAAQSVRECRDNVAELTREIGPAALQRIPGIGSSLAAVIDDFVRSGGGQIRYRRLGDINPMTVLTSLPGIGEVLARRILEQLHIHDLEDLELAIYEGRLEQVEGFGTRRTTALRQMINSMLGRRLQQRSRDLGARYQIDRPPVELLLKVDAEYRRRADANELPRIAPRRFNPEGLAWLPILETRESGWTARALFSNTAQAHALGRTRDWVVIFFERAGETHQCTVVTETRGPRKGQRVVRGRENEGATD
ncbi:MAG TPA: helix-hairpin-helix domain-containing protein [Planctomycetota bacterium]|nr:helix-hairpin-helix domain-containing protein [Planctomycetota bacterium]